MFTLTKGKLYTIGAVCAVAAIFFFSAGNGAEKAYLKERNEILAAMDATSKEYAAKAEMLLKERSHCSLAGEIEAELARLQETNAARRRQLSHMDTISGVVAKKD